MDKGTAVNAAEHLRRGLVLQRQAEELQETARHLAVEADVLEHWFSPVGTRLLPTVWAGPAADRATDGYWQARRSVAAAIAHLRQHVLEIRARANVMLDAAAQHVRDAAAAERAAREAAARAAADDEVQLAPAQTLTRVPCGVRR